MFVPSAQWPYHALSDTEYENDKVLKLYTLPRQNTNGGGCGKFDDNSSYYIDQFDEACQDDTSNIIDALKEMDTLLRQSGFVKKGLFDIVNETKDGEKYIEWDEINTTEIDWNKMLKSYDFDFALWRRKSRLDARGTCRKKRKRSGRNQRQRQTPTATANKQTAKQTMAVPDGLSLVWGWHTSGEKGV